jgi:hypothetical protein
MTQFKGLRVPIVTGLTCVAILASGIGALRSSLGRDSYKVVDYNISAQEHYNDVSEFDFIFNGEAKGTGIQYTADIILYHTVRIEPIGLNKLRYSLMFQKVYDLGSESLNDKRDKLVDWITNGDFCESSQETVDGLAQQEFYRRHPNLKGYKFTFLADCLRDGFDAWSAETYSIDKMLFPEP